MEYELSVKKMTLREQVSFLTGKDFWHTASVDRLVVPSVMVSDGPTGLRKSVGLKTVQATCFPSAAAIASAWDKEGTKAFGKKLGDQCRAERLSVLLGPGICIKRSPLCGRNFEYYSEDPFLAGTLAANYINGVQSKGVGTSLKHFAANSTEDFRFKADSIVDERALREIYLRGFEIAVRHAQPWTIMMAYNKINGTYCTENSYLMTDILRKEWGFEGLTVSDWMATADRVKALKAGLDLEMPGTGNYSIDKVTKAYRAGEVSQEEIETSARRVLNLVDKASVALSEPAPEWDRRADHKYAIELAKKCPVLLKNDNNVLPFKKTDKVAIIGARAKQPLVQGGGSSHINAFAIDDPYTAFQNLGMDITYADGYDLTMLDETNMGLVNEACEVAKAADKVLLFVSCSDMDVQEGFDHDNMDLPAAMNALVTNVADVSDNVAVILSTGSSVVLPWADKVGAILQTYLLGEGFGSALPALVLGEVSPSGKLAETYPKALEDVPCLKDFKVDANKNLRYRESIFVGYRYYDTAEKEVAYPFGYGLSYAKFEYSDLKVVKADNGKVAVCFNIKNVGSMKADEIAQLYVGATFASKVYRARKELKEFARVSLEPGETKNVELTLDRCAFEYYSTDLDKWVVEPGTYSIMIGASSRDIRLTADVDIDYGDDLAGEADYADFAPHYFKANIGEVSDVEFYNVLGYDLDEFLPDPTDRRLTQADAIGDATESKPGRAINGAFNALMGIPGIPENMKKLVVESATTIPINRLVHTSKGVFSDTMADGLVHLLNGGSLIDTAKLFALGLPSSAKALVVPFIKKRTAPKPIKKKGI